MQPIKTVGIISRSGIPRGEALVPGLLHWLAERAIDARYDEETAVYARRSDGMAREYVAGRKVKLVDATGAGDCFCGNLLARIAIGDTLFEAAEYANVAASLAVQGFGAVAPLPYAQDVEAVL